MLGDEGSDSLCASGPDDVVAQEEMSDFRLAFQGVQAVVDMIRTEHLFAQIDSAVCVDYAFRVLDQRDIVVRLGSRGAFECWHTSEIGEERLQRFQV